MGWVRTNIGTFKEYVVKRMKTDFIFFVRVLFLLAIILILFELMDIYSIFKVKFDFRDEATINNQNRRIDNNFIQLCMYGSLHEINEAIANGANVNAKSTEGPLRGYTPLMMTDNPEVIEALINSGADVNARDISGSTPLMLTIRRNPEAIRTLVNAGADVNAQNNSGKTSLMFAAQLSSDPEVITTLLEFGADPNMIDANGAKAISYAKSNRDLRNTEALRRLEKVSR